jgi:hypothetical protein
MTFIDKLMNGGAHFCYAPADENGGAGGGGSGGDDAGADGAENQGNGADNDGAGGDNESGEGGESEQGEDGKKKDSESLLDAIDDNEGQTFDFTKGEKPEGFPDEFWDAESNTVNAQALFEGLKKQEKIAKDLRAKMGKGAHKPPEKAEQYTFEASEKSAEFILENDPLVAAAKEVAHEHGLSQEQYAGFMAEMSDRMVDIAAEIQDENSPMNEEARKEYIQQQIKEIGPNGPQVLRAVQSWANELKAEGVFNEQDVETMLQEGLVSAKMVQMFNRLRSRMGGGGDIPMDTIDDGLPPDTEIAEMVDKAYASKDQAQIRKVEQLLDKRRAAGRPERLQF